MLDQRDEFLRRAPFKLLEQRLRELSLAGPKTAGLHFPEPSHREFFYLSRNPYKPGDLPAIDRRSPTTRRDLGPSLANGLDLIGGLCSR